MENHKYDGRAKSRPSQQELDWEAAVPHSTAELRGGSHTHRHKAPHVRPGAWGYSPLAGPTIRIGKLFYQTFELSGASLLCRLQ